MWLNYVTYIYDDVTYMYDDVTYMYDDAAVYDVLNNWAYVTETLTLVTSNQSNTLVHVLVTVKIYITLGLSTTAWWCDKATAYGFRIIWLYMV